MSELDSDISDYDDIVIDDDKVDELAHQLFINRENGDDDISHCLNCD
jgi:hypothetical protein